VPRFIDLQDDAREASRDAVEGAILSAAAITVAEFAAQGDDLPPAASDIQGNLTVAGGASVTINDDCSYDITIDGEDFNNYGTIDPDLCDPS